MKKLDSHTRDSIAALFKRVRNSGRNTLTEAEGMEMLAAMGLPTPGSFTVKDSAALENALKTGTHKLHPGTRAVVKVASSTILHKSDVGGVAIVENSSAALVKAITQMHSAVLKHHKESEIDGYSIVECVDYKPALGHELLLGMRWTNEFGPVVTLCAGGIYTEFLAKNFKAGKSLAVFSPALSGTADIAASIEALAITPLVTGGLRGQKALIKRETVTATIEKFMALATEFMPDEIAEFEVNPFVLSSERLVALDALLRLQTRQPALPMPQRPTQKIQNLLAPESIGIIGVSDKMNIGRIILTNLLNEGFPKDKIFIVKPNTESIDGCRCYPDVAALPDKVDHFILAVGAAQVPQVVTDLTVHQKAESILVIPGGLEEKAGTEAIVAKMKEALIQSRKSSWQGPVLNGGNCVGIRSRAGGPAGGYDTTFIPAHKMPPKRRAAERPDPVALIAQSGAFALMRACTLPKIEPKYLISIGNQTDLTAGDYLRYLKSDKELRVFAVYIEGFRPQDGLSFLKEAREITRSGRHVILYSAGRTAAGSKAMASHTASIAGDYAITQALAKDAGVLVADSAADFDDLIKLSTWLDGKRIAGPRLGVISNAGFECVCAADNVGNFTLPDLSPESHDKIVQVFKSNKLDEILDVHNPIDTSPSTNDTAYEAVIRAMLEDDGLDVGVVGCVPMTGALTTLPKGPNHREDLQSETSIASRMVRLFKESPKAWVAAIDGGPIYSPMAEFLEDNSIPTFRSIERAMVVFDIYCQSMLNKK